MSKQQDQQYVFLETIENGSIAVLTLNREPVNSMNLSVWQQLLHTLERCEANNNIRALIIQSGIKKNIFSAGNDLNELYAPNTNKQRYGQFWLTSNKFLSKLYSSRLITVALIRGACPAGGCIISLCCDYRIMSNDTNSSIGLNEVGLGIPVPKNWIHVMSNIIGARQTEYLLYTATQPQANDALRLGLVDEVVPASQLQQTGIKAAQRFLVHPDAGRIVTKQVVRNEHSTRWLQASDNEVDIAWNNLSNPKTVKQLAGVIARLSGKNKQKAKL